MSTSRKIALGVLSLAGATALTACSGTSGAGSASSGGASSASSSATSSATSSPAASSSSANAAAVIKSSLAAARAAKTVHLSGAGKDSGTAFGVDLHYGTNGASGSITMSGTRIKLILLGKTVYFKAPDSFYRKQAGANAGAVLKIVSGKWVKTSLTSAAGKGFGTLANRQRFIDSFANGFDSGSAADVRRVGSGTVDGVATTTYGDSSGQGTIDVASSGTPYPMKLVAKGTDSGTLTFTDWNKPFTAVAPPRGQTAQLPS